MHMYDVYVILLYFLFFLFVELYPTTTTTIPINFYTFKVLIDIYIQLISLSTISLKVFYTYLLSAFDKLTSQLWI